jgi:FMN-dependent oxidoreductase (nitrilotriacetate monooxygenase family)
MGQNAMANKMMHLGWFCNFMPGEWNAPFAAGWPPWDGKFHVEIAQAMERACFDYIMLEDTLMVSEAYGGSAEVTLKHALLAPKHDPAPLATLIGANTSRLGVVATLSTMAYPPFMLARLCSTLDHIAGGRFGWNIVTTGELTAAQNFGLDGPPPRELRYEIADEYVELACKLWDSWDDDAVKVDREAGVYADFSKVRPVHHEGKYFKCRGPLNTVPSPQKRPAFVQAGGSSRGRSFAARWADSVIATAPGIDGMKAYRDDVRRHAVAWGRNPDDVKVLFLVYPVIAETDEEAFDKHARMVSTPAFVERALANASINADIDFAQFNLDKPIPKLESTASQGALDEFAQHGSGKTLRQLAVEKYDGGGLRLIGTPDRVAARMEEAMQEVGGDGFLISTPYMRVNRRQVIEVTEGLVPALQWRGVVRKEYTKSTLRETLKEF